jgi:hypothetical protein
MYVFFMTLNLHTLYNEKYKLQHMHYYHSGTSYELLIVYNN